MRVVLIEDEPYMADAIRDGLPSKRSRRTSHVTATRLWSCCASTPTTSPSSTETFPAPPVTKSTKSIVASGSCMPILMLTSADRLDDKATGFKLGADDYLTKPFELRELVLRLRALDRRRAHNRPPVREIAGLRLDPFRREVYRDGRHVALTRKQCASGDPGAPRVHL